MRRFVLILVTMGGITAAFVAPAILRISRQRHFQSVQRVIEAGGGSLSFDLVDGNYILRLSDTGAADTNIKQVLPAIKSLPTGFTWIGPGEERLFLVDLAGPITDAGVNEICQLRVSSLAIASDQITDGVVDQLSEPAELRIIQLRSNSLSESAIDHLRASKPSTEVWFNSDAN